MKNSALRVAPIIPVCMLLLLTACSASQRIVGQAASEAEVLESSGPGETDNARLADAVATQDADDAFPGFKRLYIRGGGVLYIRDEARFESYDNWFLDEGAIDFKKGQVPLNSQEQAQLRMLMFRARVKQTKYYGNVVKQRGPCTLAQQIHMKRLRLYKSPTGQPEVNFISSFGEAVIVAEIKDSTTGKLVFAYLEPVKLGRGVTKSASPDMDKLASALNDAMERAHRALVEQLPVDPDRLSDRSEFGCKGQIGQNVLEIRSVLNNEDG